MFNTFNQLLTLILLSLLYSSSFYCSPTYYSSSNTITGKSGQSYQGTLTASPTILSKSQDDITLSWGISIQIPQERIVGTSSIEYVLAIYNPSSTDLLSDYIGYINLTKYIESGQRQGIEKFSLVNLREEYLFRFLVIETPDPQTSLPQKLNFNKLNEENVIEIAKTDSVTFQYLTTEPLQGHIQLTSDPTEMLVMWVSNSMTVPTVQYSLTSDSFPLTKFNQKPHNLIPSALEASHVWEDFGNSTTYTVEDLCEEPGNTTQGYRWPGYIHSVLLKGLNASTKYYYRFGNNFDEGGWSSIFYFITPPPTSPSSTSEIICFGDMGQAPPFQTSIEQQLAAPNTVKFISKEIDSNPDTPYLLLHIGDVSYARGYSYIWDWFGASVQYISTRVPYMVGIGNHEYDYHGQPFEPSWGNYGGDSGGECGIPYMTRFTMPGPYIPPSESNPNSKFPIRNLWYSFDYGSVHLTIISTEHNYTEGSVQYNWLISDLESIDRKKTPWTVILGHRPSYSSAELGGGRDTTNKIRSILEPLLLKYQIDICLWGHIHKYERTCPIYDFKCSPSVYQSDGQIISEDPYPIHLIIGNAGNNYQTNWYSENDDLHSPQPEWSDFRTANYGWFKLKTNETHLEWSFYGDQHNQVHDYFYITKL